MANPIFEKRNISPTQAIALRAEYAAKHKETMDALKIIRAARGMESKFDVKLALRPNPNEEAKAAKAAKAAARKK